MIEINLIRQNKELVKENIKKKFQDHKLEIVDQIYQLDIDLRSCKTKADDLKALRNSLSKSIGNAMRDNNTQLADDLKKQVTSINVEIDKLDNQQDKLEKETHNKLLMIPNIIDDDVPIGKDANENVVISHHGTIKNFDYDIPYHIDIMRNLSGVDLDSARKTSGAGFYYLEKDIARLHSAILSYARDFMIDKGFTYCIPPFMIRNSVVSGVMSFEEMYDMMYKIEGEDLYLIGTSEHSMIGKFIDTIIKDDTLPLKYTSNSPCFRKEVGAHGIEERGVYRVHQFDKQEMVVVCRPQDSKDWFNKMISYSVEFFVSLDVPVRVVECCSGDLADLKVKSCDIEAYSPRTKKYTEVCTCSNIGEAQSRRLKIRVDKDGTKYYPHTLNNTVVAPPRALIDLIENNYQQDGSILIPKALQPYMGGKTIIKK